MNRLKQLPPDVGDFDSTYSVQMGRISLDAEPHLALFTPIHYEPGYAYPLVVWLHGAGGNEQQLKRVLPLVSMRNFVGVAPRGTESIADDPAGGRFRWRQTPGHIDQAAHRVFAAVDAVGRKMHIQPQRIFLAGFACGGTMALRLATAYPDQFAGVLSFGGPFPSGHCPLGRINEVRNLPVFLATGSESVHYPEVDVCRDLRLFHSAGMSITLRHYPASDELTTVMLDDMNHWIMDRICGSGSAATQNA